jgi:sterol desaturase/sphingolipid hydroxylase (fatty acid hydroxylase superfamily)
MSIFSLSSEISFFVLALVFAMEALSLGWERCSLRRLARPDPSDRAGIACFLLFGTGFAKWPIVIGTLSFSYWSAGLSRALFVGHGINLHLTTGNGTLDFILFFLLYTALDYGLHRLMHVNPLWHVHRYHHSATSLNPLVTFLAHPAHFIFETILSWPYFLFSVPMPYLVSFWMLRMIYGLVTHVDAEWRWGWFGRYVIHPPAAHRLHHAADPDFYNKNLASLVLWDRLFGTYAETDAPITKFGVEEAYFESNFIVDMLRDYLAFVNALRAYLPQGKPRSLVTRETLPQSSTDSMT